MKRTALVALCCATLLLPACSQATPTIESQPTPAAVVAAPTAETIGFGDSGQPAAPTALPMTTYRVERGTVEDVLTLPGVVTPAQLTISAPLAGVVKAIYVQPGQQVAEGDLVAELDAGDLTSQLRQLELVSQQRQRELDQAQQSGALAVRQAQIDLEGAQQALEQAKLPPTTLEIAEAEAAVREAEANLATVRNNASQDKNQAKQAMELASRLLQDAQRQYGESQSRLQQSPDDERVRAAAATAEQRLREAEVAVNQAVIDFDTARNNEVALVQEAEANLDLARVRRDVLLKGPDSFVVAEARRDVARAEIALAKARQAAQPDPGLAQAVETSRFDIEELEGQIEAHRVYAAAGGEVTQVSLSVGEPVQVGDPVLMLVDPSKLDLVFDASSLLDARRVTPPALAVGQPVDISFSRYADTPFRGALSAIPTTVNGSLRDTVYRVSFDAQGKSLQSGDAAEIRITLGRKLNVLWLPPAAIQLADRGATAIVRRDGRDVRVDIVAGLVTADKVEIVRGLQEGDEVVGQ